MEYRNPRPDEIDQMKRLWKVCFGDEDAYIDFYYAHGYEAANTFVAAEQERVVSMMTLLPVTMRTEQGSFRGRYVYAVATDPQHRGRGLMTALEAYAARMVQAQGDAFLTLVPASMPLFGMYVAHDGEAVGQCGVSGTAEPVFVTVFPVRFVCTDGAGLLFAGTALQRLSGAGSGKCRGQRLCALLHGARRSVYSRTERIARLLCRCVFCPA